MDVAEPPKISAEWHGTLFGFCSPRCREKFQADPEKFLGGRAQPIEPSGLYTCPMHPEVVRRGPGACPKCGMALEPKTVSLEPEDNAELREMSRRLWVSLILSAPVFVLAMAEMIPALLLSPRLILLTQ